MRTGCTGAVVAAAGLSSRMGNFKPLLPLEGGTLLEAGLAALRQGGAERIYVVTGHRAEELRPVLARAGAVELYNPDYATCDMFASVRLGLAAAADCDEVLFLPGDVPLFTPYSVHALLAWREESGAELVRPCYGGQLGHPVLMGRACLDHVRRHSGARGLAGALECFGGAQTVLELPDPGLLLDVDTPQDYRRLLQMVQGRTVPTPEVCRAILRWFGTPAGVVAHSQAVAENAMALCTQLSGAGLRLSLPLVQAGALLHDAAKGRPHHAEAAGDMLTKLGYPRAAWVVSAHMDLPEDALTPPDERAVVYYADKITQGTQTVTIAQRFAGALERFAADPEAQSGANRRMEQAFCVERAIQKVLGGVRQGYIEAVS